MSAGPLLRHGLIACLLIPCLAGAADLKGVVKGGDGQPVGGAKVLLATAGVREGTSPLCPSCYPDCVKSATTDAEGRFAIVDVDDALVFNVLVAAPGFRAAYARGSDPRKGEVTVTLTKAKPESTAIRGKVLDPEGKPVFGALVEPAWFGEGERMQIGGFPGDDIAVSDVEGIFELVTTSPKVDRIGVKISAPQLARKLFTPLPVGSELHEYRLNRGVTVQGRLLRDGKPVPNASVSMVQNDRNAETFLGVETIGTDIDGKFEFANVPPGEFWSLSACRDTLSEDGVTASIPLMTTAPDTKVDVGDLTVENGTVIQGQVRLADGKPVPPNTRVLFDREGSWDPQTRILGADGRFRFAARSGDEVTFYARVSGYTDRITINRGMATGARLNVNGQTTSIDIVLERKGEPAAGKTLTGVVRTPDGQPAKGAGVSLLFPQSRAVIENGAFDPHGVDGLRATTDAQGRYAIQGSISESPKLCNLLVLHESGWAEAPYSNEATIDLTPWVKVAGTARHGNVPLAGQTVKLSFPRYQEENTAHLFFQATAKTDEKGAFTIDRAVPGIGRIGVLSGKKDFMDGYFQQVGIELTAGKAAHVDLGGTGATVKGRIDIPSEVRGRMEVKDAIGRMTQYVETPDRSADRKAAVAVDKRRQLTQHEYGFEVAEDGTFEIRDVASGTYALSATFPGREPSEFPPSESVGDFATQVLVTPDEREVVVKGTPFRIRKTALRVGEELPAFTAKADNGQSFTRDSFRDRPGVVIFAYEHNDADLIRALAAISADSRPVVLRVGQGAARESTNPPGFDSVSGAEARKVTEAFGVQVWPTYFVVSKEGTVIARERVTQDAVRKIAQAFAGKP